MGNSRWFLAKKMVGLVELFNWLSAEMLVFPVLLWTNFSRFCGNKRVVLPCNFNLVQTTGSLGLNFLHQQWSKM